MVDVDSHSCLLRLSLLSCQGKCWWGSSEYGGCQAGLAIDGLCLLGFYGWWPVVPQCDISLCGREVGFALALWV